MSESVCELSTHHLVPGTNSEIEGLTLANSGTNFGLLWDLFIKLYKEPLLLLGKPSFEKKKCNIFYTLV